MRCLYALVGVGLRYTYSVKKKTETHVQNYTLGTTFLLVLTHGIISPKKHTWYYQKYSERKSSRTMGLRLSTSLHD
jgi:hypothetical protein